MANKFDTELTDEQISSYLSEALRKVETEADPDELSRLKKLYKKCIPLGRRSYVAGYLTQLLLSKGTDDNSKSRRRRSEKNEEKKAERTESAEKKSGEKREKMPRVQIPDDLAATIFVGIGRNRKVFPHDLVGLVASVGGIERERIGNIKVLANYSFVQLFIVALNEYEYRGKKLNVSYSKLAESETPAQEEAPAENSGEASV